MNLLVTRWLAARVKESPRTRAHSAPVGRPHRYSHRPQLEALEGRLVPSTVSGEAFGVSVALTAPIPVSLSKTPDVVLPSQGGMEEASLVSLSQPGVLTASALEVSTEGSIGPRSASSESQASLDNLNLLNGFITADLVSAMSTSISNGTTASSSAAGSALVKVVVNGTPIAANVAPNTTIGIVGVGTVILNEQIFGGDGVHTTSLTVNMIDVTLDGSLGTGQIIVSSAHSDVNFTAPAEEQGEAHMTGGGRIGGGDQDLSSDKNFATFGFTAGLKNGAPEGQLEYQDHGQGLNFHSTAITKFGLDPSDPNCATFSGTGRLNGVDGYTFTVRACDNADPGRGADTFKITITGPGFSYSSDNYYIDMLTAGNIEEHRQ